MSGRWAWRTVRESTPPIAVTVAVTNGEFVEAAWWSPELGWQGVRRPLGLAPTHWMQLPPFPRAMPRSRTTGTSLVGASH